MSQHCKFKKQKKQIYLNGIWVDAGLFREGDLYERNSYDCGYISERWTNSGYTCVGTSKYFLQVKEISNNGMTWTATTETRRGTLIENNSFDCGYIATEWRNTGTMCDGVDKYYQQTKYISDNGTTWTATTETRKGSLIESQSVDCLTPDRYKAVFYIFDEDTHGVKDIIVYPCDGDTTLDDYYNEGKQYPVNYELIKVGNCVTEIVDGAFYLTGVFHLELPENGNLTRIGRQAFSNTSLGYHDTTYTVRIPDTVQIIDHQAFDCTHGTLYDIGTGCTYVGGGAFDRLKKCGIVNFNGLTPPAMGDGWPSCSTFRCYGGGRATVTVPCGKREEYNEALTINNGSPGTTICENWSVSETCTRNIFKANYSNGTNYMSEDCNGAITITTAITKPSGYQYTAMTSCELGSCVYRIGDGAFSGFTSLQSISKTPLYGHTPVSEILNNAFLGCTSLTDVNSVTSAVTSIGNSAFSGCTSLSSITIGDSIEDIGNYAFKGCTALTGITILNDIPPLLGIDTFADTNNCTIYVPCDNLYNYLNSSSWIPYLNRLQSIQGSCWNGKFRTMNSNYTTTYSVDCNSSTTLTTGETKGGGQSYDKCEIGSCVDTIGDNAFQMQYANYIKQINSFEDGVANIPSGVTSIGNYAFNGCSGLTEINLPSGLTSIGNYTFSNCKNLTEINIPSGVTNIPSYAFKDCTKLSAVTMYSGATLNFWTFKNCGFKNLNIQYGDAGGTSIFSNCTGLTTANIKCFYVGDLAFQGCNNLSAVTINCSGTSQSAFSGLTGLKEATINATYSIGNYTFASCTNLSSLTLTSVATIGENAFANCDKLTSVVIPDSTTRINSSAFKGCDNLESVTIGSGVTYIAQAAFSDNPKLATVTIYATTPPTLYNDTVFSSNKSGRVIYVPSGSVNAYKTAQYWTRWANSIYAIPT